ncbi:hypothetical protein [Streptomyces sp. NPDC059452]|uniref:hypothetical protein n=1 Tax=Streptomyces sp. NPDC059452 TaxID=3346835 RepID=UPI0036CDB314
MTRIPLGEVTVALVTLGGGPDDPPDDFTLDHYVLCELGEHTPLTEHAALISPADTPHRPALWFLWTGTDTDRTHRITTVPWCPAVLRILATASALPCSLFNHHTGAHSWSVTDPLGDLIAGPITFGDTTDDPR